MVLQREDGAALVAGASAPAADRTLRLRVIRAFLWDGEVRAVDEVLTLPYRDGRALITYGKAAMAPEPAVKSEAKPKAKPAESQEG